MYHPKTDVYSEKTIQTIEDMLRARSLDFKGSWNNHLPLVEFAYKAINLVWDETLQSIIW